MNINYLEELLRSEHSIEDQPSDTDRLTPCLRT